ncbi:MAG: PIN domain-containing protein [Candidatus Korarchaeota archaeon]|nr:PIN domain-containing protein [Candidatus Korarchaeota archaeon]
MFNIIEYPPAAKGSRILFPRKGDYLKALEIMVKLREIGKPTPAIDVLIAAMCIRRDLRLLTKDKHFLFIKEVEPDFMVHVVE